jgi:hypothetical protein
MLTDLLARLSPAQFHRLLRLLRIRLEDAHSWLPFCPCGDREGDR